MGSLPCIIGDIDFTSQADEINIYSKSNSSDLEDNSNSNLEDDYSKGSSPSNTADSDETPEDKKDLELTSKIINLY